LSYYAADDWLDFIKEHFTYADLTGASVPKYVGLHEPDEETSSHYH